MILRTSLPPLSFLIKPRKIHLCSITPKVNSPFFSPKYSRISAVNKPIDQKSGVDLGWLPVLPHVITASMANFLFGYHIGVMNGPIEAIAYELGFDGDPFLEGLVVSIFIVGAFLGSIGSASLINKFGCRRSLQFDMIPLIIGALLSAQAHSLNEILWGRFLVGLGIGVNTALVPIYISEVHNNSASSEENIDIFILKNILAVSPTKYRGSLGTLCQIGTCFGIIMSLTLALSSENDPHCFPAIIVILGMQFAVESPRWLCKAGRIDDAKRVISSIWSGSDVQASIEELQSVIKDDSDSDSGLLELFKEPHNKAAFIGASLFILQQFAGINGVLYFSSLTFKDVGVTSSSLASLFVGITNFAGAMFALFLIENQGRQKLLVGSYLGMAFSMFLIVYSITCPLDEGVGHNLSVLGSLMYIFTFAIGAGPVTGLIIPELSSSQTRAKVMGFSFSVHWVCNFLVGLYFLELVERFGVAPVYATFGSISLLAAVFSMVFIEETKGRSLEDIELSLNPQLSSQENCKDD